MNNKRRLKEGYVRIQKTKLNQYRITIPKKIAEKYKLNTDCILKYDVELENVIKINIIR